MNTQKLMEFARQRHQAGDLDQAGTLYQRVLALDPEVADAWNLAGVLAHQIGHPDLGLEYIAQAIELQDDVPAYYLNMATALMAARRAREAEQCSRKCLELDAGHILAWNVLGNALHEQDEVDDAVRCFERAIELDEQHIDAWVNLGRLYRETGRLEAAERCTRRGLRIDPEHNTALNNLGAIKRSQKDHSAALELFEQVARQQPESPRLLVNLGNTLQDLGRYNEAKAAFLAAVEKDPADANAWNSLGFYYQTLAQVDNALDCFRHALRLRPGDTTISSNYLFGLNLAAKIDREACFEEHVRICDLPEPGIDLRTDRSIAPDRSLRVGYLSPDLFRHPMVGFFEPILAGHDREQFEVFCYANVRTPDDVTDRLRQQSDHWRRTFGQVDRETLELIRHDQIDILVDLAGHTANNRLSVLAARAAPVQVSMLGYLNTTGLRSVDYYITDEIRDPVEDDRYYVEEVIRLPGGGCCWQPPANAPEVAPAPFARRGYITFGSTHRPNKLTEQTLDLWARILHEVNDSRLLVFHNTLSKSEELQAQILARLQNRGISHDRVDLAWDSAGGYLIAYAEMDVLLEATPWSSGTTALESMWMGVPIPTILGDKPCGRTTASALERLELSHLVARGDEEYIQIVASLASATEHMTRLRTGLRDRMQGSICQAARFVRELETAYRDMWKRLCDAS